MTKCKCDSCGIVKECKPGEDAPECCGKQMACTPKESGACGSCCG